jgi:hypothetical protein
VNTLPAAGTLPAGTKKATVLYMHSRTCGLSDLEDFGGASSTVDDGPLTRYRSLPHKQVVTQKTDDARENTHPPPTPAHPPLFY